MRSFDVAITGIGVICAAGENADEFWEALATGRGGLAPVAAPELSAFRDCFAGEVDRTALDKRVAELGAAGEDLNDTAKMALVAACEAIARAGLQLSVMDRRRIGLVTGKCQMEDLQSPRPWMHAPHDDVAHHLGLEGPRIMVSTACAAGANAIGLARDKLWTGEADVMVAGGVDVLQAGSFLGFTSMQALAPNPCAPYSRSNGLNLGEGAGYVVLEPLRSAQERGAHVYGLVLGYGLSADAYHATAPEPTGRGAASAVRRALAEAQLEEGDVDYVNGHGTGTPANDKMERKAMRRLFGADVAAVPISSTKSFVGHTLGAAGAIETIACLWALASDNVPPTLGFEGSAGLDAEFDFVPGAARPTRVDVAISNSYAFGGNNCSVVLGKAGRERKAVTAGASQVRDVAIVGIGTAGAMGVGVDALRQALRSGEPQFKPISHFDASGLASRFAAEMCELDGRGMAPSAEWRHLDAITRQALTVARSALADAGVTLDRAERDDFAVVMGTGHGPATTGLAQNRAAGGPSARAFSQMTLNAPAGKVCQLLGFRGPTTTITTGALSGTIALATAVEHLRLGKVNRVLVIATDELFGRWLKGREALGGMAADGRMQPYSGYGTTVLGSMAVALLLESSDVTPAARPYARIASIYQGADASNRVAFDSSGRRMSEVIASALDVGGLTGKQVDLCVGWAGGYHDDVAEAAGIADSCGPGTRVTAPKSIFGDCESASGLLNVAIAALAITDGVVPPTQGAPTDLDVPVELVTRVLHGERVDNAVALDGGHGSGYAATVLGRVQPR